MKYLLDVPGLPGRIQLTRADAAWLFDTDRRLHGEHNSMDFAIRGARTYALKFRDHTATRDVISYLTIRA